MVLLKVGFVLRIRRIGNCKKHICKYGSCWQSHGNTFYQYLVSRIWETLLSPEACNISQPFSVKLSADKTFCLLITRRMNNAYNWTDVKLNKYCRFIAIITTIGIGIIGLGAVKISFCYLFSYSYHTIIISTIIVMPIGVFLLRTFSDYQQNI